MTTPYELSPEQQGAVSALDGPQRYQHFLSRVADTQAVYGLRTQEGWVSACDDNGAEGMPVWPHPAYAAQCASGEWAGSTPAAIDVFDFADDWLPAMSAQGVNAIVFPTAAMSGVLTDAAQLGEDLELALTKY